MSPLHTYSTIVDQLVDLVDHSKWRRTLRLQDKSSTLYITTTTTLFGNFFINFGCVVGQFLIKHDWQLVIRNINLTWRKTLAATHSLIHRFSNHNSKKILCQSTNEGTADAPTHFSFPKIGIQVFNNPSTNLVSSARNFRPQTHDSSPYVRLDFCRSSF